MYRFGTIALSEKTEELQILLQDECSSKTGPHKQLTSKTSHKSDPATDIRESLLCLQSSLYMYMFGSVAPSDIRGY